MSDSNDSSEKTEQPTDKKRRDSREEGQVAQSKELTTLASVTTVLIVLYASSNYIYNQFNSAYLSIFKQITSTNLDFSIIGEATWQLITLSFQQLFFVIILAATISALVNILQLKGIILSKEFLKFDIEKLNPISNFKSIFSIKNFIKFFRQILSITIMTIVAIWVINDTLSDLLKFNNYNLASIIWLITHILVKIFVILLFIHLFFSIIDYIFEQRNLTKELMMTKDEVKQELKNTEGDAEIKGQRKELYKEMMESDVGNNVSNSTLVLANPTHIAIVIVYKPQKWALPIILMKAKGRQAELIFRLAKHFEVPIIQDKWLARQLYSLAEPGKFIPSSLVAAVADVIGKNMHLLPKLVQEMREKMNPIQKPTIFKNTKST